MKKTEILKNIYKKIVDNRIYWFPFVVLILGIVFAVFIFPNTKSEPFRPVKAVEGVSGPIYSFFTENIEAVGVSQSFLIDNPGQNIDYKWQFRQDGVFVYEDNHDDSGFREIAKNIVVNPEYFDASENKWMSYEKSGTSSVEFTMKDGQFGEKVIERSITYRYLSGEETLTESWLVPMSPDNQKFHNPKATFSMSKNYPVLWRLKWNFSGLEKVEKDNVDMKDENGWPIRKKAYGNFTIDVDDFDNFANDRGAFSFSEYAQISDVNTSEMRSGEESNTDVFKAVSDAQGGDRHRESSFVEIVFYPNGTDGERSIDPVVAASGIATGWTDSKQRNIFHNGDYFYLLYTDGSGKLYYRTATSSIWTSTSTLINDLSTTDPAFDFYVVDDSTFDIIYISNNSKYANVSSCTTSDASISCGATSSLFQASGSVSIARTGHNRIWAAGRGDDDRPKVYSADYYGSATSGTTWLGESTSTPTNLTNEITMAPYIDNDKVVVVYSVNLAGSSDDELMSTTISRGGGFTASSTITDWNSGDIDISGLVWINDDDFRILARDNTAATGTSEFMYATSSNWVEVSSNIDPDYEIDGTNPSLAVVTDQSTTTLYAFLIDSGSGNLELYQKTYSGVWSTEYVVSGAESGTRSLPVTAMSAAPMRSMRYSPRELPFAYRVSNGSSYDFYVGSVGLAPKIITGASQVFGNGQATSSISAITITNCSSSTMITAASDVRIRIATSSAIMRWDTSDTSATITGSASGKVSATVSYEGVYTLVINVTSDFSPWDSIIVSDLSLGTFSYANPPNTGSLRLYLNGASDLVEEARDLSSVAIYGQLAFSDHTMGQLENQWSALSATSSTYHYRFKATPIGEDVNIGTTTFALSGISGVSTADIVSAKLYYDGNGNGNMAENDWANSGHVTYNGGGSDVAQAIAIDSNNNIYVAGYQAATIDWAIRKYTSSGILDTSWGSSGMITYNTGGNDFLESIAIDNQNNIYVAGRLNNSCGIRKYTSAGILDTAWGVAGIADPGLGICYIGSLVLSLDQSIYFGGKKGSDPVMVKFTPSGILDKNWGNAGVVYAPFGVPAKKIFGFSDKIYLLAYATFTSNDWVIFRYNNNGTIDNEWGGGLGYVVYDAGGLSSDDPANLVCDSNGNLYVVGYQETGGVDWVVCKYDTSGQLDVNWGVLGKVVYDSGSTQYDYPSDIIMDTENNIYVAGRIGSNIGDWAVRKYDKNGISDSSWGTNGTVTYNSGSGLDMANAITIDSQKNIYVVGKIPTNTYDWAIRKYDPSGQIDIYQDTFFMPGDVNISGTDGTIVFATSSPYKVTKATDFLLELTVSNIAAGDSMTVDYSSASSTGVRSRLAITPTGDPSAVTHRWGAEISSAANQVFAYGQATTSISNITITDRGGIITAANNIRVKISTTTSYFLWDTTDTTASISGGASGKVSTTVSYEQGGGVLLIDVTSDFSSGDTITVSDLSFASFNKIGKLGQGTLQLYLDGASDVSQDGKDDKTIAITAAVSVGEHTQAQSTNQWSALSSTANGTHYRFRLTSTGETTKMQNALFDFSGITGVVISDISNAFLYADVNRDGYYGYSIPEAWYLGYDSATAEYISALVVDTVNGVVYAGQGNSTGDGDIYYCRPNVDGDADGICEGGEFTKSYEGAQEYIWAMAIDTRSGAIYAGQGSGTGDGDIYRCTPKIDGDADGLCETGEWTKAYEGSEEYIYSLAYDSDNSVMYAGQGSGTTDGNIYACAPYDYGDKDGLCETGEWYGSYNGNEEGIYSLVYESYNNIIFAGEGVGSNGLLYYCQPNIDGNANGICEYGEWSISRTFGGKYTVNSLVFDNVNNTMYVGFGNISGYGDVWQCNVVVNGLCTNAEWLASYDSTTWEAVTSMTFDPGQKAIYIGGSTGSGDGDIYRCFANTNGDADGICESGEWSAYQVFNGSQEYISAMGVDPVNGVVYAGQGSGTGDGDIYYYSTGDYKIATTGTVAISGSTGTISFSTTSPWFVSGTTDYIIQFNGANIANGDAITIDWNGASTTGVSTAGTALVSGDPASATHRVAVTLGTAADQAFAYNGASTAMSPLTITDVSGIITSTNDIRITIATTSVNMRWDSADTSASISGTAAGKVSGTVSYADGDATLVIDVTSNFSAGETITVSDLNFKSFNTVNYPYQAGLELYLSGAGVWNQDGRNTNTIAVHGTAVVSNHALGSMTNTWHALNENMSEFLYRYRVTPTGETLNLGTTTISLPSFKGISADDISNVVLYYDANGDGALTDGVWGDNGSGMINYNSGSSQLDYAYSITIDSQNNIYVAGYQQTNGYDWAIRKYNSSGQLDTGWGASGMVTYDSGSSQPDSAYSITIDSQNNIYVAGSQQTNGQDWAIRKYNSSGQLDTGWGASGMVTYNSGSSQNDYAYSITIDSQNNIYVAGFQGTNGYDWAIRKYNPSGQLDTGWGISGMVTYNSGSSQNDSAYSITIDSQNNIYVAGYQGTNGSDWAIRKYNSSGQLDTGWGASGMVTYNSGSSQPDSAYSITIDSQNNIYVAGFQGTNDYDWAIRKYDSSGQLDTGWGTSGMVTYNSGSSQTDYAYLITMDSQNNIYVAGYQGTNGNDWAIRKYDAYGNFSTYTDGSAANGAVIEIANGSGTITLATSSAYRISQSTDFLLKMTLTDVEQAEELKIDFSDLAGTGYTSDTDFTWSGDPGFSLFYKPEYSIEGDVMFEGTAVFE